MKFGTIVTAVVGIFALAFLLSILLALPVMWLWDASMPELFGFKTISLWMAWKVSFLSSLLFKSTSVKSS
jgi:hypothetical protein